jgi:hypothetical protein
MSEAPQRDFSEAICFLREQAARLSMMALSSPADGKGEMEMLNLRAGALLVASRFLIDANEGQ